MTPVLRRIVDLVVGEPDMLNTPVRRLLVLGLGTVLTLGLAVPPASAAPPANDQIGAAQVIRAVPSRMTVNTAEATVDPSTDTAVYPCMGGNSVWYRFTPTTTVTARAITAGSDVDTLLGVFTGDPGALAPVGCSDDSAVGSAVEFRARAGTTYWLAVSTCCSTEATWGGNAVLRLYVPRALAMRAPVRSASAGEVSGRAHLSGTYTCTNPSYASISVTVSQRLGSRVARGGGCFGDECDRRGRTWSFVIDSETGFAFRLGEAVVTVSRDVRDGFDSIRTSTTQVMTLSNAPDSRAG